MQYQQSILHQKSLLLCAIGKECYELGWSPATSSSYSIRYDNKHCAITSSGKHKGRLQPEDILLVDFSGTAITQGKPNTETLLHTQLYQSDENIGAVLHTHSPASTMLGQFINKPQLVLQGWELLKALPGVSSHEESIYIPIFKNSQDISTISKSVDERMKKSDFCAYLIKGHGIYTWGKSLEDCFKHLEALEALMTYELAALKLI